jgi:hypothetical protein
MRGSFLRGLVLALVTIVLVLAIGAPRAAAHEPDGPTVNCSEELESVTPEFRYTLLTLCRRVELGHCEGADA